VERQPKWVQTPTMTSQSLLANQSPIFRLLRQDRLQGVLFLCTLPSGRSARSTDLARRFLLVATADKNAAYSNHLTVSFVYPARRGHIDGGWTTAPSHLRRGFHLMTKGQTVAPTATAPVTNCGIIEESLRVPA